MALVREMPWSIVGKEGGLDSLSIVQSFIRELGKGSRNGIKNKKTIAWEALSESITGCQAERFNDFLNELWDGTKQDQYKAAELFLKTCDFFRPKMSRVEAVADKEVTVVVRYES